MSNHDEWATLVRRRSRAFAQAREHHDWDAAATEASGVVEACRHIVRGRREQRTARGRRGGGGGGTWWFGSTGGDGDANEADDQVTEYYLNIAQQMARAHDEMRRSMQKLLHQQRASSPSTCVRTTAAAAEPSQLPRNADEWRAVHRRLEEVADLYTTVQQAVDVAGPHVDALEHNLESGQTARRQAERAIRHYHDRHVTVAQAAAEPPWWRLCGAANPLALPVVGLLLAAIVLMLWHFG